MGANGKFITADKSNRKILLRAIDYQKYSQHTLLQ